jgi:hypothetical protein
MVARYFAPSEWRETWQLGIDVLLGRRGGDADSEAQRRTPRKADARRRRGEAKDAA